MTMKRNAKTEALTTRTATLAAGPVPSRTPGQYARYGRITPATVAAATNLTAARSATRRTREIWATARIRFVEPTRTRTAPQITEYVGRRRAA